MQTPSSISRDTIRLIQTAIREWIDLDQFRHPHAVTLTLKQALPTGKYGQSVPLTPEAARQNVRHFHNVLSRRVLGGPAFRRGERLPLIGVWEHGDDKRLHYHGVIDCVTEHLAWMFPILIVEAWHETRWGHRQIHFGDKPRDRWLEYITKARGKPDFLACLDIGNWWLPNP